MKEYAFMTPEGESKHAIYLRSTKQWVPCTKKQFDDYYRDINAFRRTQQNHGRCKCPPSQWLLCDTDCFTCLYRTFGDTSSLDANMVNEDGEEMTWLEYLQEIMPELQSLSVEDSVVANLDAQRVLTRIGEIMPEAIEIGKLRLEGLSDEEIASHIGIPRTTFRDRIKSLGNLLGEDLKNFF